MTDSYEELLNIANSLEQLTARGRQEEIQRPLERLDQAVREIAKAWSGSWIGYHANVYYRGLQPSPPGAHFSEEWGFEGIFASGTSGDWVQYAPEQVEEAIYRLAGNPDMKPALTFNEKASGEFHTHKLTLLSIVDIELSKSTSPFLSDLKEKVNKLSLITNSEFANNWAPQKIRSRDSLAMSQGIWIPPHCSVGAEVIAIQHTVNTVTVLEELTRQISGHLLRQRDQ